MRTLSALLTVLLLCSVQQVCSGTEGTDASNECCPKLTGLRKIPLERIEFYWWTSSKCAIKAVVFYTVAGKRFCADPSWGWVKSHMKTLPEKKPSTTSKP